jgi:hypothetical protein
MSLLSYPTIIRNPYKSSSTELNNNFAAIGALVNGKLSGDNFSPTADLTVSTLTVATLNTRSINTTDILTVKLSSTNGSNSVTFNSYQGSPILKVKSNGLVEFAGLTPFLPIGTVLMYNGSAIVNADTRSTELSELLLDGWYVCNGQSSTPDLRNKFILGAISAGVTGGSNDAQVPQHTHTVTSVSNNVGDHTHTGSGTSASTSVSHSHYFTGYQMGQQAGDAIDVDNDGYLSTVTLDADSGGGHTHTFSIVSGNVSRTHTHSLSVSTYTPTVGDAGRNRPPFYSLIFIKRMQ